MIDRARVIKGAIASGGNPTNEAGFLERVEARVHGGQRDVGEALAHLVEQLLGTDVPVELDQRLMDHEALGGDAVSRRSQRGLRALPNF